MWALTAIQAVSIWAISPLIAMALLALTGLTCVFVVWHFVGFDVLTHDEE